MRFSCFAPMGLYRLAAGPPEAENIYNSLIANLGGQYNTDVGSRMEATCFAQALGLARANRRVRAAADERLPLKCNETLPAREAAYGLVPGATATMADRHAALAARAKLPSLWTATAITAALSALLGSDFIQYKPTPQSAAVVDPATCGAWPMNLQRPDVPRKSIALAAAAGIIGTQVTVTVTLATPAGQPAGTANVAPVAGDVFVFEAGRYGQADRVAIVAVSGGGPSYQITTTFTRPHDPGTVGVTQPYPYWASWKKHSLVVVSAAAAADPERRRKIDEAMRLMVTTASTWDIVAGTTSATTQFQLNQPSLSMTTLGAVALP